MAEFADVLKEISALDDSDRATLEALAAKYPALDESVLRQREFSRKLSLQEKAKAKWDEDRKELEDKVAEWDEWLATEWDPDHKMTKAELAQFQDLQQAKARLAEFEAGAIPDTTSEGTRPGAEGTMEFTEVLAGLEREGYVKKADLAGYATSDSVGAVDKKIERNAFNFEYFYKNTLTLPLRFAREFGELGEDFDTEGFMDFATSDPTGERLKDLKGKAYTDFTAQHKQRLEFKKQADQLAKDKADFEAAKAKDLEQTTRSGPTDDGSGPSQVGHLQRRMQTPPADKDKIDAPLGSGITAAVAAEQYRKGELVAATQ